MTLFFMPINQDQSWGSNAKMSVTYTIKNNVAITIGDSHQKYVVLKPWEDLVVYQKIY